MSIFDKVTQQFQEDVLRLKSVKLAVPDDEVCAKAKAENADWHPRASILLELEPMSYRLALEGDPVSVNRNESVRVRVTKANGEHALEVSDLPAIRTNGWLALQPKSMYSLNGIANKKIESLWVPYQRWAKKAFAAGLHIDVDAAGNIFSNDVGQLFVVEAGYDTFPRADDAEGNKQTYDSYMVYIVKRAPADYVALPLDRRETKTISLSTDTESAAETATTTSGGSTVVAFQEAFKLIGVVGQNVAKYAAPEQQQSLIAKNVRNASILGTREVLSAAQVGKLFEWAVDKGVLTISGNGVISLA